MRGQKSALSLKKWTDVRDPLTIARLFLATIFGQGQKRSVERERELAFSERYTAAIGSRRFRSLLGTCVLAGVALASNGTQDAIAVGETRSLTMVHSHTGESLTITYKRAGSFDSSALEKLNWFLRDWRVDEPISMSPNLFDIVWHVYREVGASEPIKIMSAYRSPGTNAMLRRRSRAVAKESQHMRGNAMDIHIPGVSVTKVREIGLRLQRGGVGYYPSAGSPFVHLDVGSVRHWPKMSRDALERVFPDGKTVHIPADGKPLENYQIALAEVQARGGSALDYATVTSGKSFWALLFGGSEEGEEEAISTPARGRGRGATRVADARGGRGAASAPSSVTAFAGNADNPMNAGVVPVELPTSRPVVVAALPQTRVEPPRLPDTRTSGLRELDTKGELKQNELPKITGLSRFEPIGNVPLPPIRPRGAAFATLVASAEPSSLPMPPVRPVGLGGATAAFTVASVVQTPAPTASPTPAAVSMAAVSAPLPPARPDALRGGAGSPLPGVIRGEGKAEVVVQPAAQAYAAVVGAPLPPQRQSVAPAVGLPAGSRVSSPVPVQKVVAPAPALDAGRANARAAGQKPLAVPAAVATASPGGAKAAPIGQDFAARKHMPSLGFSGSFVREIDASGGFGRLGR